MKRNEDENVSGGWNGDSGTEMGWNSECVMGKVRVLDDGGYDKMVGKVSETRW